jgi:hypothetical protein
VITRLERKALFILAVAMVVATVAIAGWLAGIPLP